MLAVAAPNTAAPPDGGALATPRGRYLPLVLVLAALTLTPVIRGKLQLVDLAAAALLPFLLPRNLATRHRLLVTVTTATWAAAQLLSDHLNGIPPRLSMQLVTAVGILALCPALLECAQGDEGRLRFIVAGVALGLFVEPLISGRATLTDARSWKYELTFPLALSALALADARWRRGSRGPVRAVMVVTALVAYGTDDRHTTVIALLVLAFAMLPARLPAMGPAVAAGLVAVTAVIAVLGFVHGAHSGWFGARSQKQVERTGANPLVFIANVRPELLQESYVASRKPIVGYGSQPALDSGVFNDSLGFLQSRHVLVDVNLRTTWAKLEVPGLAAHSMAADSWVRAGIGALPFWLVLWGVGGMVLIQTIRTRGSPLIVFFAAAVFWDSLFSPMTDLYHLHLATFLALVVAAAETRRAT